MRLALRACAALASVATWASWPASAAEQQASFVLEVGQWMVAGDRDVGGCLMIPRSRPDGTKLTIAIHPARDTIQVALSNAAWLSLADEDDARIDATFWNGERITDSWSLASKFTSSFSGGPRINFEIERAKNDQASFLEQLRTATKMAFWRQGRSVMLGLFDLKGSAAAADALLECRAHLRAAPNFDPFAD